MTTDEKEAARRPAALPGRVPDADALFESAMLAIAQCADIATAAGSTASRTYVAGASGALRHAYAILFAEGRVGPSEGAGREVAGAGFDVARRGRSEMIGAAGGWDTILRCRLPDGSTGTVRAVAPMKVPESGVWLRPDPGMEGLWRRGIVSSETDGMLFRDDAAAELPPVPHPGPDLARDLVDRCGADLSRTPALAAALEATLVSGSWLHLGTGRRWFSDAASARTLVRMLGGPVAPARDGIGRLRGMLEREAVLMIEGLGWRHVPTPS